jgi:hypothetical protein
MKRHSAGFKESGASSKEGKKYLRFFLLDFDYLFLAATCPLSFSSLPL